MLTTKNTVLWLPFEGNAVDKGVNSFATTPTAITYTAGLGGKAATFNGTSSNIELLNSASMMQSLTDVTICFYVYFNSVTASQLIISNRTATITKGFTVGIMSTGKMFFDSGDGNSHRATSTSTLLTNTWYFVACRKSTTGSDIFINDHVDGTVSSVGLNNSEAMNLSIGVDAAKLGPWFGGMLKNVQIYNKRLSDNNLYRIRSGLHPLI